MSRRCPLTRFVLIVLVTVSLAVGAQADDPAASSGPPFGSPPADWFNSRSTAGGSAGMSSPFSVDNPPEPLEAEANYDRVLDLFPSGTDRDLIKRVREAVQQSEIGVDTTDERWITVSNSGKRITWGGRIDTDSVNWADDNQFSGQQNYVEFRRLRLMASGTGYGVYDYQLEMEFSPEFNDAPAGEAPFDNFGVEVKDAFIGLRDLPVLGYAMVGHFRTPIGLSAYTSSRFTNFMERPLPSRLLPGRELGVAMFNHSPGRNVTWAYGAFFDSIDEAQRSIVDDNQGTRAIARVTCTPFFDELTGAYLLHTGFGYCYTRPRLIDDPDQLLPPARTVEFSTRPEIHVGTPLIRTGDLDAQQYQVMNMELAWASGPLTIQSEGTYLVLDETAGGSTELWGAYVEGSWFLTGERRPYDRNFAVFRRVIPYENFWVVSEPRGCASGLGAWELVFRWSQLNFTDVTDQYLNDLTTGLNWYWNPHARVMLNWIHPMAHNSPVATAVDATGDVIGLRMQVDF